MNKLIKHEFRATARLLLPLLLVYIVSALVEGFISHSVQVPGIIVAMVTMIYVVSFIAIFIVGLVIIISRFYKNTMTDSAYLTMTLPITEHEFIWGELITNLLWAVIIVIVLALTSAFSVHISGIWNMLSSPFGRHSLTFGQIWRELIRNGVSGFGIVSIGIQALLGAVMAFIAFCMHFYCSMAIGQLFNKHRILMSVIAYILIRMIIIYVSSILVGTAGNGNFNYSFDTMARGVDGINLFLGMINLTLAVDAAVLYVPTFLLIGKKLNLQWKTNKWEIKEAVKKSCRKCVNPNLDDCYAVMVETGSMVIQLPWASLKRLFGTCSRRDSILTILDAIIYDIDGDSNLLNGSINNITSTISNASRHANVLTENLYYFGNDTISETNSIIDFVTTATSGLQNVTGSVVGISTGIKNGVSDVNMAVPSLQEGDTLEAFSYIDSAMSGLSGAVDYAGTATQNVNAMVTAMNNVKPTQ